MTEEPKPPPRPRVAPMDAAIKANDLAAVKELLASGVDPNPKTSGDSTTLHYACACGHLDIVTALLGARADVTAFDPANRSPVHVACRAGGAEIVKALLASLKPSHVAIVLKWADEKKWTPLHDAVLGGCCALAERVRSVCRTGAGQGLRHAGPVLNGHWQS